MWLLYGEDGQTLKTMIAHGAPAILVGNPLYLYLAFPESVGIGSKSLYITATDWEGNTIGSSIDYQSKYYSAVFSKAYVGEMIGCFVDGQSYDVFEVKISVSPNDDGIVMQPRTLNIVPTVIDADGASLNLSGFNITVLANGKKAVVPMITLSQYQKLLSIIGNMAVATPKGFANASCLDPSSEIYMVFFKGIGMIYGKIVISSSLGDDDWTTIASYDTDGKYKLRSKSISIANNSLDSDGEIRAIQKYSATEKDINGDYVPTTIDVQIFNASIGDSIEFSSPISIEYKDLTFEADNDQIFLRKTVADATYLPFDGGTMTGDISMTSGKVIKLYNAKAFTFGDYSISFATPTADSVVAYQSWVSSGFATKSDLTTGLLSYDDLTGNYESLSSSLNASFSVHKYGSKLIGLKFSGTTSAAISGGAVLFKTKQGSQYANPIKAIIIGAYQTGDGVFHSFFLMQSLVAATPGDEGSTNDDAYYKYIVQEDIPSGSFISIDEVFEAK